MSRRIEVKKRVNYNHDEILDLIKIWKQDKYQKAFLISTRHKLIWDEIAREMRENGYDRCGMELKYKLNNMKQDYRRCRTSKDFKETWPYYDEMHTVLQPKPFTFDSNESFGEMDDFESGHDSSQSNPGCSWMHSYTSNTPRSPLEERLESKEKKMKKEQHLDVSSPSTATSTISSTEKGNPVNSDENCLTTNDPTETSYSDTNEWELFGQFVESEMRHFKSAIRRKRLKRQIIQLIFKNQEEEEEEEQ